MIKLYSQGVFLDHDQVISESQSHTKKYNLQTAKENTITYNILKSHNQNNNMQKLRISFDALASHDITYVGIIQTARASGMREFELPYVLTNCHNSLCAVGGTINEDDHIFGLSAAKKYGGIFVPPHLAVIHQYMREVFAGGGKMILGSDSHTRYGALGTIAIGEGGPELVKQLLKKTYDINYPQVVCVYLTGRPSYGVGPQDVALEIIKATFANGFVKNKIMEFVGDGVDALSVEYRMGIDVMTTETTCLSSVWKTDEKVKQYLSVHNRQGDYRQLQPKDVAYYDNCLIVDLSKIKPNIALPFHPSNVYSIQEFKENAEDILNIIEKEGRHQLGGDIDFLLRDKITSKGFACSQAVIAGCAGGMFENIVAAADILNEKYIGSDAFSLSVYPSSQPIMYDLTQKGVINKLMLTGATIRSAFCGPCFGAGDVPNNQGISIRHTTRNFPNREGSKPADGQIASVALMDARSIAATAANKGILTGADETDITYSQLEYKYNDTIYKNRVYNGWRKSHKDEELVFGPNITPWPPLPRLAEDVLIKVVSVIMDPVTTTDELIPSGETSSYRSNPLRLAEFTLSRKDSKYVQNAKDVRNIEEMRQNGTIDEEIKDLAEIVKKELDYDMNDIKNVQISSAIFAVRPGDGSAREQAASCQRVLGAGANIAGAYATKRYRSNLINWGMMPFIYEGNHEFQTGEWIFIPKIKTALKNKKNQVESYSIAGGNISKLNLKLGELTDSEREILLAGGLINYYNDKK
jgi:aconitate hydratase